MITVKDANAVDRNLKTTEAAGEHTPHQIIDNPDLAKEAKQDTIIAALTMLLSYTDGLESLLTAIQNKIISAPATEAKQDSAITRLTEIRDKIIAAPATEATLAQVLAKIIVAPATEAKQDVIITALAGLLTDTQLRATPVNVNLPAGTEVAGPAAQSAINVDLLTGNVNGWYDARAFQSGTIQIVAGAGISAGQIIFEQTNDASSTVGIPLMATEVNVQNANPQVAAFAIAASTSRMFRVAVNGGYVRVRIAVAFVGGNVRAFGLFSDFPYSSPIVNVQQATGANLNMQVSNTPTVTLTSTRITPNAANGHSTTHHLISAATTNATLVKNSAGAIGLIQISNNSASPRFFKLYNLTTAPTVGTSTPIMTVLVGAGQTVFVAGNSPIRCGTGISYAITGGMPVADTTAIGLNEVSVSMFYT